MHIGHLNKRTNWFFCIGVKKFEENKLRTIGFNIWEIETGLLELAFCCYGKEEEKISNKLATEHVNSLLHYL